MASLFERRLLTVIGKGGVGKSTISAALALVAARRGKRVLVCELNTKERVSALLGAPEVGASIGPVAERIDAVDIRPREALREYALMVLRFRSIYDAVFENRFVRHFLRAIPSLAELVMLGKVLYHVDEKGPDGRFRYDLVILDSPATGHGLGMLRLPQVLTDTVPPGPLADEAAKMRRLLTDDQRSAAVLVALPESMPVSETVDLDRGLRETVGMARAALVLNGVVAPRFSAEERARLEQAAGEERLARAVLSRERRAELSSHYAERLALEVRLPQLAVPFLFSEQFGRAALERVADALEAA
ncbi:MAG TPA: ATPase [Myxococcales bacterium]|jgi:anion-transporting  ArsA/GET3 family ATPase|nr:ATPase [Myxococcales bacterium]